MPPNAADTGAISQVCRRFHAQVSLRSAGYHRAYWGEYVTSFQHLFFSSPRHSAIALMRLLLTLPHAASSYHARAVAAEAQGPSGHFRATADAIIIDHGMRNIRAKGHHGLARSYFRFQYDARMPRTAVEKFLDAWYQYLYTIISPPFWLASHYYCSFLDFRFHDRLMSSCRMHSWSISILLLSVISCLLQWTMNLMQSYEHVLFHIHKKYELLPFAIEMMLQRYLLLRGYQAVSFRTGHTMNKAACSHQYAAQDDFTHITDYIHNANYRDGTKCIRYSDNTGQVSQEMIYIFHFRHWLLIEWQPPRRRDTERACYFFVPWQHWYGICCRNYAISVTDFQKFSMRAMIHVLSHNIRSASLYKFTAIADSRDGRRFSLVSIS